MYVKGSNSSTHKQASWSWKKQKSGHLWRMEEQQMGYPAIAFEGLLTPHKPITTTFTTSLRYTNSITLSNYATISCSKLPASCHKFCKKMHLHQHSPTIIKHTHPTVDTTKYQHTEGTACMQSNTIYYGICLSRKKVIPAHTKLASGTDLFYLPGGQNVPYSTYTGG